MYEVMSSCCIDIFILLLCCKFKFVLMTVNLYDLTVTGLASGYTDAVAVAIPVVSPVTLVVIFTPVPPSITGLVVSRVTVGILNLNREGKINP